MGVLSSCHSQCFCARFAAITRRCGQLYFFHAQERTQYKIETPLLAQTSVAELTERQRSGVDRRCSNKEGAKARVAAHANIPPHRMRKVCSVLRRRSALSLRARAAAKQPQESRRVGFASSTLAMRAQCTRNLSTKHIGKGDVASFIASPNLPSFSPHLQPQCP